MWGSVTDIMFDRTYENMDVILQQNSGFLLSFLEIVDTKTVIQDRTQTNTTVK